MEQVKMLYESPEVEIMNIEAETCFATSPVETESLDEENGSWF